MFYEPKKPAAPKHQTMPFSHRRPRPAINNDPSPQQKKEMTIELIEKQIKDLSARLEQLKK